MYPEYSYARYTFDGLDSNMAGSLARASYVIVGTEEGKRQIVNMLGVYHGKVRVIPFPTPLFSSDDYVSEQANNDSTPSGPFIFYPSRFWPHKNHVVVLAAVKILRDIYNIELRCIFCGADGGNLGHVLQYADELGVRDQVEYVGVVSEERLLSLYQQAFALVYASAVGLDNLPPLEAISLSCRVITSDVTVARERRDDCAGAGCARHSLPIFCGWQGEWWTRTQIRFPLVTQ
jgi:glycosyltransferase involved in cell wall biosynthesis